MGNVLVEASSLSAIADAIRDKLDTEDTYKPAEMAEAIESISGGGSTINNQDRTVHPSASQQTIEADSGYTGLGEVTVKAVTVANLSASNIVEGVTVKIGDEDDDDRITSVTGTASGGGTTLGTKSITVNGTYDAEDDNLDGYSSVTVNVGGGTHDLPSEYTEYEYIEGTGTQYINTGYAPNSNTEVIAKFMRTSNQGYNAAEFGCREPSYGKAFASGIYWAWGSASDKTGSYNPDYCYGPDTVRVNLAGVYDLNNTKQVNFGTVTWTAISYPFFLMARNNTGTAERIGKIRFYYFAAYENNVKQIELIPAMRNSDSVLGMYDTVNNTFLTNAGSGSFVGGAL